MKILPNKNIPKKTQCLHSYLHRPCGTSKSGYVDIFLMFPKKTAVSLATIGLCRYVDMFWNKKQQKRL